MSTLELLVARSSTASGGLDLDLERRDDDLRDDRWRFGDLDRWRGGELERRYGDLDRRRSTCSPERCLVRPRGWRGGLTLRKRHRSVFGARGGPCSRLVRDLPRGRSRSVLPYRSISAENNSSMHTFKPV